MFSVAGAFDGTHVLYALPDEIVVEGTLAFPMIPGPQAQYDIPAELSVVTIIPLKDNATFRCYGGATFSFGKIDDGTIGIFTLATSGENPTPPSLTITQKAVQDYTLTIDVNDGSTAPVTVTQATKSTYTLPFPERDGYVFYSWDVSGGGGLSFSLIGPAYTFGTGDGTVTSQWKAAPEVPQEESYVITNPYKDVDWSVWGAYKGNLHTHTTFSDGTEDLKSMAEEYYNQGYDVIANTDHGVVSKPWNQKPQTVFPLNVISIGKPNDVLSAERMQELIGGAGRDGRGMIQVPLGIELQAATVYKSHVVGLYGGWGQNWIGLSTDYRIPIAGTQKSGGVSIIAHPGDWLKSESNPAAAKDPANVNFFADILRDYESCLGIEIYNGSDGVTRQDRVLWDQLLMRLMPEKRQVWGFSNDDSHNLGDIGRTAEILFMPSNTADNVRTCIETGAFLACSRRDRIRLPEFTGDKDVPYPGITNIIVEGNTITLEANNYSEIEWIADGEIIGTGLSIDLTNEKITSYVRAQLIGDGGITATQPFGVDKGDGYRHPNDAPQGLEKLQWTVNLYLTKNVFGWAIENIAKLFK